MEKAVVQTWSNKDVPIAVLVQFLMTEEKTEKKKTHPCQSLFPDPNTRTYLCCIRHIHRWRRKTLYRTTLVDCDKAK